MQIFQVLIFENTCMNQTEAEQTEVIPSDVNITFVFGKGLILNIIYHEEKVAFIETTRKFLLSCSPYRLARGNVWDSW